MDITYLGHSSFKLRGKTATLITDPYNSDMVGLKFPKHTSADIVTISHDHEDHNALDQLDGAPFVIRGPGEYDIKEVEVVGIASCHDNQQGAQRGKNTIYRIAIDGVSVVHLGDLGHLLSTRDIEDLDGVDVLLVPVGGVFTIDAREAATIVHEIEPSIVIPMHYGRADLNQKGFSQLQSLDTFLKEMGKEGLTPVPKLTVAKGKFEDEMQVVALV